MADMETQAKLIAAVQLVREVAKLSDENKVRPSTIIAIAVNPQEINEKAIRKIVVPEAMSPFEDKTEGKVGPEEEKHTAGGVKNVGGAVGELKGEGQTSGQIKSKKEATKTTGPTAPRNFDELRKTSSGTPRSRRTSSVYPAKHKLPFTSGEKTTPLEDSKDVEKGLGAILTSTPSSDTKTTAGGGRKRSGARKGGPMCGGAN